MGLERSQYMLGLALEGGGARGAFHIGAIKALLENGYVFDGVVGTSIGAFNAALLCQGDFDKAYEFWMNAEPSTLFDIEDEYMRKLANSEITKDTILYLSSKAKSVIGNKGIDTSKLRGILDQMINEEKVRESQLDFGMVTVSIPDFKPLEIYKEDIPMGQINDYIMASANYPGFKLYPIDGKYYIDGGIHDNCPVNLLIRKGYKNIIAIRTSHEVTFSKLEDEDVNIINIIPTEDLGRSLIFDNLQLRKNIAMGYCDALKMIYALKGKKYYIESLDERIYYEIFCNLPIRVIEKLGNILKIGPMNPRRMLFEKIIPILAEGLKIPRTATYQDICLSILEEIALQREVER